MKKRHIGLRTRRLAGWYCAALGIAVAVSAGTSGTAAGTEWLQWGGPSRNFMVPSATLSASWPAGGPKRVWERPLGEGHSSILAEGGRLYTMYRPVGLLSMVRRSQQEVVTAIDASTGKTIWEYSYAAPTGGLDLSEGAGPHSTPLIVGGLLYAMSSRTELFALDKQSGKLVWTHDLQKELGAPLEGRGYSASPISYRDTIIVPAGGPGASVIAFNAKTGAMVWKGGDFPVAPASPVLINVDGQDQLVVPGADDVAGVDPTNGNVLWTHANKTSWGLNISTPVWGEGNLLLISAAYNNGTRLLKLSQAGGRTTVKEQWYQNRMRTHIGTIIRLGDFAVGSSGDFGPCPTVGIDIATGQILWSDRSFARSTFLYADNKLVILDEDGQIGLASASRSGLKVLAKAPLLTNRAWTVPTLAGSRLYVRDRKNMLALELN